MIKYDDMDYRYLFGECGFTDLPNGNSGIVHCPKHADVHPSMSITINKGLFNCFSCGYHGNIAKEYKNQYGHWYNPAEKISASELSAYFKARQNIKVVKEVPKGFTMTPNPYNSPAYKSWLEYRGISEEVAKEAGTFYGGVTINYVDDYGEAKSYCVMDRVMFPIYDKDKKIVNLEMRFPFSGKESEKFKATVKKVLYPKRSSTNLLYEEYKLDKTKKLYILEGLMDCLAFRSLTGIKNSTTIFGAMITKHQKELLNEYPELCYVYNNDEAGLASVETVKKFYTGKLTLLKPADNYDDVGEMAIAKFTGVEEWLKSER